MKNVLVVNFRKYGDIFNAYKFTGNIERQVENARVSTIGFKEFEQAFKLFKIKGDCFLVDRKLIQTYFKNRIYSDALAINEFMNSIEACIEQKWDLVINASNDEVGINFCSFLKHSNPNVEIVGNHFANNKTMVFSDIWSRTLNEITTSMKVSPINYIECFNQSLSLKPNSVVDLVNTVPENNQIAFKNFQQLRSTIGNGYKFLAGIQLKSSTAEKDIPTETIVQLIDGLINQTNIFPVLLIAPIKEEQEAAEQINKSFADQLTIVETDFIASPSVLINLDTIITPDTSIKHLCDLLDVPVVEYAGIESPRFKMWTTNPNSIVVNSLRSNKEVDHAQLGDLLISACNYTVGELSAKDLPNMASFLTFLPLRDKLGIYYKNITGPVSHEDECTRAISRYFLAKHYLGVSDNKLLKELNEVVARPSFNKWASSQKEIMTNNMRTLLSCIRTLGKAKENSKNIGMLIESIDSFIATCEEGGLSAIPALYFRSRFENCPKDEDPMTNTERALFEAKKDFQALFDSISQFDQYFLQTAPLYHSNTRTADGE